MASFSQNPDDSVYKQSLRNIREYCIDCLGGGLIKVEVTERMVNRAIIDAIQYFSRYYAFDYQVTNVGGANISNQFDIPDGVDRDHIADVLFQNDSIGSGVGGGNIFQSLKIGGEILAIPFQTRAFDELNLSSYWLWLQQLEDIKKVFGIDRHWEILGDKIQLYPSTELYDQVAVLHARIPPLQQMEQEPWIREYSLAKVKTILGGIRRKFSSMQMPGGGLALDGNELISEGKEEMQRLMEELQFHRRPLPIAQF